MDSLMEDTRGNVHCNERCPMLVAGLLRILSLALYVLLALAPGRFVPFSTQWVYYSVITSMLALSAFRLRFIFRSTRVTVLVVLYTALPFVWALVKFGGQDRFTSGIEIMATSFFFLLLTLCLPISMLLENRIANAVKSRDDRLGSVYR